MSDGYRDGIRVETRFIGDGFGIDPDDCGCTDCLTGEAFHSSDYFRIDIAMKQGRPLYNQTGHEVILPGGTRLDDGESWHPARANHCPGCICNDYES